ncbi:MAG: hypothetical protein AB1657_01675 [Candidatus Micrarchaeota archaeon]
MRGLLLALALVSLAFAGPYEWQALSLMALVAGLGVLIIFYLLSYVADSPEMRGMATSEMYQLLMTGVIIAIFMGVEGFSTSVVAGMLGEQFGAGDTHINFSIEVTQEMADYQWGQLMRFAREVVEPMAVQSGYSGQCAFLGFTFSYNGCASIAVPVTSGTLAARAMATSFMILSSQLALLYMARDFFFPVLLPAGLFLRTFHATRGAGGFLIAIAAAFYFIYPVSVLVTKGIYDDSPYGNEEASFPTINTPDPVLQEVTAGVCDPYELRYGYTWEMIDEIQKPGLVNPLLSHFFIGGLLTTAVNLLAALSSVRALSRIFGTEVDVSALARIA